MRHVSSGINLITLHTLYWFANDELGYKLFISCDTWKVEILKYIQCFMLSFSVCQEWWAFRAHAVASTKYILEKEHQS